MTQIDKNNLIIQKTTLVLESQVDSLDTQTRQHLRIARETALSKTSKRFVFPVLNAKWLTGAALAGLLAFAIIPNLVTSNKQENTLALLDSIFIEDTEMLEDDSELELYTQLDFYQWLEEADL